MASSQMQNNQTQNNLVKAKLVCVDDSTNTIEFMFNPKEIHFSRDNNWEYQIGNRGTSLLPKVYFAGLKPFTFELHNLIFDTYETKNSSHQGKKPLTYYIDLLKKCVTPVSNANERPPVYYLQWQEKYFHCVVTRLSYTFTMFHSDGTPLRALVDLDLLEVDPSDSPGVIEQTASIGADRRTGQSQNLAPIE
ncbi:MULTISPECIES: hypothetical protein [Nostoc]|uniref:Contractile injection system tube protein N-terminal domain-containing protein n=1 Tax=Nostoc paludosum FACHB-159 TaxID=2692908 RepID=A0ABR8KDY6_9NOSO|nr:MULTISPECIES: hypothetical protein [Nostoc]MBD2681287.1 hypothetical protein [Nostoc sp. FACHB-857]MBD2737766.1 hypothetical protein [Nostoc paludosum FACHB-159]